MISKNLDELKDKLTLLALEGKLNNDNFDYFIYNEDCFDDESLRYILNNYDCIHESVFSCINLGTKLLDELLSENKYVDDIINNQNITIDLYNKYKNTFLNKEHYKNFILNSDFISKNDLIEDVLDYAEQHNIDDIFFISCLNFQIPNYLIDKYNDKFEWHVLLYSQQNISYDVVEKNKNKIDWIN